ncbi:putative dCTP deaminase [Paratrimastix pyriformis]|uniref:dCTP deaminase n=1 Tax=Paratrimastix pyriformis TaxID=342808 RepID=A0ABQ8UFS3_9EUKA|nr:putative dCTP deaminase [Paratrimastix pyriformis]
MQAQICPSTPDQQQPKCEPQSPFAPSPSPPLPLMAASGGGVLSHDDIMRSIERGDITITPFNPQAVGCASVDLTLSNEFRYFIPGRSTVHLLETTDYKDITEKVLVPEGEFFTLNPGQCCLAITQERVKLAPSLCGFLEGRSRFARLGIFVHITASFMQPGINNQQVLEIFNASNNTVALHPGARVCQFIFLRLSGEAQYHGRFAAQEL